MFYYPEASNWHKYFYHNNSRKITSPTKYFMRYMYDLEGRFTEDSYF